MGLFGAISAGLFSKKGKDGGQSDTSKPFHTHDSSSKNRNQRRTDALASRSNSASVNLDGVAGATSFMGAKQQSDFAKLTNPKAELDRGGRTITKPEGIDPVGIEPAMNPPPDIDKEGVNSLYSPVAKTDPNLKSSDTIYKRNGSKMNKIDFNNMIKSNESTLKNTKRHNDSVKNRANEVSKMFPMESSSMKDVMMGRKLKKEINKGRKSITEGIQSGSFTREVDGKEIDRRSFNTTG